MRMSSSPGYSPPGAHKPKLYDFGGALGARTPEAIKKGPAETHDGANTSSKNTNGSSDAGESKAAEKSRLQRMRMLKLRPSKGRSSCGQSC